MVVTRSRIVFRVALQKAVTEYVGKNYEKNRLIVHICLTELSRLFVSSSLMCVCVFSRSCCCSGGVVTETSDGLSVVISAQVVKYSAYWSGRWKSEWTIGFDVDKAKVEGTICVMAHYYEKGNVQMHNVKDVPAVQIDASV